MRIETVNARDLDAGLVASWRAAQHSNDALSSPFFAPEFAQSVAAARTDAFVGIILEDGRPAAFFPFHRRGRVGVPIGGPLSDFQGPIGGAQFLDSLDVTALLRGCGIDAYDYNHAPAALAPFKANAFAFADSPASDLSRGFEAWREERRQATSEIEASERKLRQLAREVGPVRFVADDREGATWNALLAWKSESYRRVGAVDILGVRWVLDCLEVVRTRNSETFAGLLSSLYAGDRLVAAQFGLRSTSVWHWWFPTYDSEFEKYSPGLALLLEMARAAPGLGVSRIDLGRGRERYKRAFANAATPLCEGSLERPSTLAGALRRAAKLAHAAARGTGSERLQDLQRRSFSRLFGMTRLP